MASSMKFTLISFACTLLLKPTQAEVICERLTENTCAFGISSSGKRCVLENYKDEASGDLGYTCRTSEVEVERYSGYVETDHCMAACGVNRRSIGISSDAFLSPEFTARLCSPACYQNCPNIVDLYFNLAAGEGVFLPSLCKKQKLSPEYATFELLSSGGGGGGGAATDTVDGGGGAAPSPALSAF